MTGGQPSPTSPVNLGGQASPFKLEQALEAEGAEVIGASAYDYKELLFWLGKARAYAKCRQAKKRRVRSLTLRNAFLAGLV